MLNITTRITLSNRATRAIKHLLHSQHGSFTESSWTRIHKVVKNEISARLFANQGLKCVYCERYLIGLGHEIDHFAHKALYPEFTFITTNLFYSCKLCNSSARKGQKNTINIHANYYNACTFLIVHPFNNIPASELFYSDPDRIYFDRAACSQLGRDTIDFFQWEDLLYTTLRSRNLLLDRLNPLASTQERLLIQQAISYKA